MGNPHLQPIYTSRVTTPTNVRLTHLSGDSMLSLLREASMRTLAVVAVFILGSGAMCRSFAQAVAEGAMVHANSATATTKVGSALGNALSNAMAGNAQKSQLISGGKLQDVPDASRNALGSVNGERSSGPLVITSIRGGFKPCTRAQPPIPAPSNSSDRSKTRVNASVHAQGFRPTASSAQDCGVGTGAPTSYKSVVNLGSPK